MTPFTTVFTDSVDLKIKIEPGLQDSANNKDNQDQAFKVRQVDQQAG